MSIVAIEPEDEVYRRLAPDTVDRASRTVRRNAFYTRGEPDPEISVHVRRLAGTPEEVLQRAGRPSLGIGLLAVSDLFDTGFGVEHRPTPDDPSHAVIQGVVTRADRDKIADKTTIVKLPDPKNRQP